MTIWPAAGPGGGLGVSGLGNSGWGATFAYTYTNADQNRDINEHYSFDEATINQYPFITSNSVPKHRFVATGSYDGPWGFVLGGKLTVATPIPINTFSCYNTTPPYFPTGSGCTPVALTPPGQSFITSGKPFGYRDIDVQATKDFDLTRGMSFYLRFDILNVFNYKNYNDYLTGGNSTFGNTSTIYNPTGNITGYPRTLRMTAGFRF